MTPWPTLLLLACTYVVPVFAAGAQDLRGAPSSMPSGTAFAPKQSMRPAMPVQTEVGVTGVATAGTQPLPITPPVQADSKLPTSVRSSEWQLEQLWKKVQDLQHRLAVAEKRLAEHRHVYSAPQVNQLNYRTVRSLLEHADTRDGLLNFPGMPVPRETGLPVVPAAP